MSVKFRVPVMCDLSDLDELYHRSDGAYNDPPVDEMFQPLPLTEEWMEIAGFFGKYKSVHVHWSKNGVGIEQASDQDDNHETISPAPQEFSYDWQFNIEYVHQLQDLYQALTGEKLIFDPNIMNRKK